MKIPPFNFNRVKLRVKFIIALVGMAMIPLIIALTITILKVQNSQLQNVYTLDQQVAQTAAEQVKSFILSQYKVLDDLGNVSSEFSDPKIRDAIVERMLFKDENFVDLTLTDANGQEISRKNILKVISPQELVNRSSSEEFMSVKETGYYLGPIYLSNGKPYFLIGKQISNLNHEFQGAVFAIVDVRVMQDVVKKISAVGEKGRVFIVDGTGKVIAHPDISEVLAEKNYSKFQVVNSLIKGSGKPYGIYENELGHQVLGSGIPISIDFDNPDNPIGIKTNWFVIAEQPTGVALASVYQITQFNVAVLIVILIGSVIGTLIFSRRIVGPIESLSVASKKFGEGQLNYRLNLSTGDELEDLALGFNNMAAKLEQGIAQLTSQNRLLNALRHIDRISLSTQDVQQVCQGIVDEVSQGLGYIYGGIALVDQEARVIRRVARTANFQVTKWLDTQIPIPFEEQAVSMDNKSNLLVKVIDEKQSFYSENLYDLHNGIFNEDVSRKIQEGMSVQGILAYPLITQHRVLGVIYYLSKNKARQEPGNEFTVLSEYTTEAARAIENALLYQSSTKDRETIVGERNKLALTLSGINDAVIAVDVEGKIVIFNSAAEKLTGIGKEIVLGSYIHQIMRVFGEGKEIPFNEYCPSAPDDYEGLIFSKQNLRISTNKDVYADMIVGYIKNRLKLNIGAIITLHDLTREKQLEEMKLDFVSMAAHELRTPLTSIKGYVYIFLRNYRSVMNPQQLTYLTRMSIASQRLSALVENLLNVTRIEKKSMTIHIEKTDWIENAGQLVEELKDQAVDKNIRIIFEKPETVFPPIEVDRFRVNEVLSNFISNAINYTSVGGVVKIWFEKNEKEIITHVQDNGMGIPKEALPHLFTKFFRVSGKLEQGSKGTGLGLYISKSIIEMHNGRVWVESELDKGSTFSFALPIEHQRTS